MNPKSFCPQCTTEWDRPWYDICPSCGHRFIGRPWWQSPTLIVLLICLPAIGIVGLEILAKMFSGVQRLDLEGIAMVFAFVGIPVCSIVAAVIMVLRSGRKGAAVAGWSLLWALVFGFVSLTLGFFSCLYLFA